MLIIKLIASYIATCAFSYLFIQLAICNEYIIIAIIRIIAIAIFCVSTYVNILYHHSHIASVGKGIKQYIVYTLRSRRVGR